MSEPKPPYFDAQPMTADLVARLDEARRALEADGDEHNAGPLLREAASALRSSGEAVEPHCSGHERFDYDCIDCSDALERKRKGNTAGDGTYSRQDSGEAVAWPDRMVNLPCPDGSTDRILGFRIPEGDPILGEFGLSEPLAWLRSVTVDRCPATPATVTDEDVERAIDASDAAEIPPWIYYRDVKRTKIRAALESFIRKQPATPASAWRPSAEGWALVFSDPRDFCASASKLIGATYSDPDAAARRFANKSLRGEGMVWGDILAFAPTPPTSAKGG